MESLPLYWLEGHLVAAEGETDGSVIGSRYERLSVSARTTARHEWMADLMADTQRAVLDSAIADGFNTSELSAAEHGFLKGDMRDVPVLRHWPYEDVPLLILRSRGRDSTWKKPTGAAVLAVSIKTEEETLAGLLALGQLTGAECISEASSMQDPRLY